MAALALMTAACSNDDNELPTQQPQKAEGIPFTATISIDNGTTTRALAENGTTIEATWADGETVALIYDAGGTPAKTEAEVTKQTDGTATISANLEAGATNGSDVTIIYPATAADGTTGNVKADLLAAQDGTLTGTGGTSIAEKYDVRKGSGKLSISGGTATVNNGTAGTPVSLTNQFAIFKFTLDGVSIDATHPLVIKDGTSNETITTVKPASTATSVYAAMPAAASSTYKFVITTADNKYIKSGTATIEAGKYYQTSLSMTTPRYPLALSSATVDDLGSVACAVGHLHMEKTAVPAGCTAVGIVGKVTETGHGLILSLQDATDQNWNTINGWAGASYASTTLKVLPDDAALGSLTGYTSLGTIPVSNWAVAQKSDYEAIFINLGSTTSNSNGTVPDIRVNAYFTTNVGGTEISTDSSVHYWSATDAGGGTAWRFRYWYNNYKTTTYRVRPVLGF